MAGQVRFNCVTGAVQFHCVSGASTFICGGGGDPCEFCTATTTPGSITARISAATALDCTTANCDALVAPLYTLTQITPCYYEYTGVFVCNGVDKAVKLSATLLDNTINAALDIANIPERSWTITGLGATYDCSIQRVLTANSGNGPHCDLTGTTMTLN